MRAILIDPTLRTVSEVDYDGDFRSIYRLLGEGVTDFNRVRFLPASQFGPAHVVYVDGAGLLKPNPGPFFRLNGYDGELCGRGLILAKDWEGESIAAEVSRDGIQRNVTFSAVEFIGFEDTTSVETHPILGEVTVFSRKAIFK